MLLQVRRRCDEKPTDASEKPRNKSRVGERARADREIETLFDEVHRARRRDELNANLAVNGNDLVRPACQQVRASHATMNVGKSLIGRLTRAEGADGGRRSR